MRSQLDSTGFAARLGHVFRRPSTWLLLGAGLLAADRLRWLPTAWTGATLFAAGTLLALSLALLLVRGTRRARRREVRVLVLPLSKNRDAHP